MTIDNDLVRYASDQQALRGHSIDRAQEKEEISEHFMKLGHNPALVRSSLDAIAPECLCCVKGVWLLTLIRPVRLSVYSDRIVYVRRLLWFHRFFRHERAVMIRHIREVETDYGIISNRLIFRTHQSQLLLTASKLSKCGSRSAARVIQALIHEELAQLHASSADDLT